MNDTQLVIDRPEFMELLKKLAFQIADDYRTFSEICFLGIQRRGSELLHVLKPLLNEYLSENILYFGDLDITFFRDDYRKSGALLKPNTTYIPFSIEERAVILVDDVLYTGRTVRSALDAMLAYGRPSSVQLLVLVDRKGFRQLPIEAQYVGKTLSTTKKQRVKLDCENYQVWIVNHE
jgi:pyrimidine operon attenuation protein/uracil phosphoribosyltransferase